MSADTVTVQLLPIAPVIAPVAASGQKNSPFAGMAKGLFSALLCGILGGEGGSRTLDRIAPIAV